MNVCSPSDCFRNLCDFTVLTIDYIDMSTISKIHSRRPLRPPAPPLIHRMISSSNRNRSATSVLNTCVCVLCHAYNSAKRPPTPPRPRACSSSRATELRRTWRSASGTSGSADRTHTTHVVRVRGRDLQKLPLSDTACTRAVVYLRLQYIRDPAVHARTRPLLYPATLQRPVCRHHDFHALHPLTHSAFRERHP